MALKTAEEIERDFFSFVKASELGKSIKGEVYRSEMRPNDATTEDLVVKFLAGLDEQVQSGVVILNLYVPDIAYLNNGRKVINHKRVGELQKLINGFVADCSEVEYLLKTDGTTTTYPAEEIEQHIISTRIKFYRLTD